MALLYVLLSATLAAGSSDNLYPVECSSEETFEVQFLKGRVTEEKDQHGLVKLTFQFLPHMKAAYSIELDIRVVFHFMDIADSSSIARPICVGLASIHLARQKDGYSAYREGELRGDYARNHKGLMFFDNFKEFEVKARFDPSIVVGDVHINKTCWDKERKYSTCVQSLQVGRNLSQAFSQRNPFSEDFWVVMKGYMHLHLGAELERLHMAFPDDSENVLFQWLMWNLDEERVDIYDFRMSSSEYYPDWGSLNTTWLQIMPLLIRLDLSNNGISELQPVYLTAVTKTLTYLNIGRNKLSTIPPEIYNLTKLTFLDLSRNPFHNVDSFFDVDHLKSFQHVTFFNMSHVSIKNMNHIASVLKQGDADMKPMNLTVLDLSFCDLKDFHKHPELFAEQRKLTHLFLAGNRMVNSPRLRFGDEQQLFTIDLTFNNLTTPLHILDVGSVTNLNMSFNNITNWTTYPEYSLRNFPVFGHVRNLNLSLNTIPAITEVMGNSLENLKTVDLGDNPIDCEDCSIPEFKKWLQTYQANKTNKVAITLFNRVVDDFNCTMPSEFGATLVSDVIFDELSCQETSNLLIILGIPLAAVGSVFLLLCTILYAYRYEATYIFHLVKIKKRQKASATRNEGDYKYDAFVCYSGSDRAWVVGELLPTLENGPEKYRLCLHERDFMLGTFITSNIVGAMQNSRSTIIVLTENFVKSQWCKWELEMANHKLFEESREFLVLIELERLDRSILPRYLKYLMDTRTYLEWPEPGDRTGEVEVVYSRLKEALGPSIHEMMQEQMKGEEICTDQDIPLRETKARDAAKL